MNTMLNEGAVKKYVERRAGDLQTCLTALSADDYKSIARIGHNLKGNGETFGFPELSDLGNHLESAALAKDAQRTALMIGKFGEWVQGHSPEDYQ